MLIFVALLILWISTYYARCLRGFNMAALFIGLLVFGNRYGYIGTNGIASLIYILIVFAISMALRMTIGKHKIGNIFFSIISGVAVWNIVLAFSDAFTEINQFTSFGTLKASIIICYGYFALMVFLGFLKYDYWVLYDDLSIVRIERNMLIDEVHSLERKIKEVERYM